MSACSWKRRASNKLRLLTAEEWACRLRSTVSRLPRGLLLLPNVGRFLRRRRQVRLRRQGWYHSYERNILNVNIISMSGIKSNIRTPSKEMSYRDSCSDFLFAPRGSRVVRYLVLIYRALLRVCGRRTIYENSTHMNKSTDEKQNLRLLT